ncbi:MAG TPA: hypothetical protein VKT22_03875 [Steroidobacteraceae bacterium]|nr:hypothetical protein [Steroidobacteraceae bacterium]
MRAQADRWTFATRWMVLALTTLGAVMSAHSTELCPKPDAAHAAASALHFPPAPKGESEAAAHEHSAGCQSCHNESDQPTMHASNAVTLGCTDCHGGNATVSGAGLTRSTAAYTEKMNAAHVLPRFPEAWNFPSSAKPVRSYTLLNKESQDFVRFVNPSDFRVVHESCGACHRTIIEAAVRSLHSTSAMFWGGASYNNGILDFKNYILGEAYDRNGVGACVVGPPIDPKTAFDANILPMLYPLPAWETVKPADIFRVFERGGRNINNQFAEVGLPDSKGELERIEEPGRPDFRQSNRGPGTGARIAIPVLNIAKTRLNDPHLWFMGTNDQPGDYRESGCASCHVVYANDVDPRHSSIYAQYGHDGLSQTVDPTIDRSRGVHPLKHAFTRSIPSSQCMVCHMHQPNMFMNTFYGYTMWDYEADAPAMWPKQQKYPSIAETRAVLDRNPEGAAPRGNWGDINFLKNVYTLNPQLKDTQFADYHGHGWNFRAVFKRDRQGTLLDEHDHPIADEDPSKWSKAVKLASSHEAAGMQCVDCHFSQDNHGNGHIYGEVAAAIEIGCKDCHGTVNAYPNLYSSGPAALGGGMDLAIRRTPFGDLQFEYDAEGRLWQRSMVDPSLKWQVNLVKDTVTPGNPAYNIKAARAKLMGLNTATLDWGKSVSAGELAHGDDKMECYTCHTSWTTGCAGCHLPIEANWKTARHLYEGGETRNYATYNPQVARDDMFLIGHRESAAGGRIAPYRSSSALVLSSTNVNREHIYVQQPPVSASGYSSQAFNPHYPHTERKVETKTCSDCHLSKQNDNNAIMAQLLMYGTNFVNFVGYNAYVGGAGEISAVNVTEWEEPQAVIGSYLHRYAYPDAYAEHGRRGQTLAHAAEHSSGTVECLQLRGEYLYVAEGGRGTRVYDVASIGNKGVSERIITAPFSPLGHDTRIASPDATCVALPTNQPINPARNLGEKMRGPNQETPIAPLYHYAYITDAREGLIVTNVDTLQDGEPRNNFLRRALTWNPNGVLTGARHITIGGNYLYILTPRGLVIVGAEDPLKPQVVAELPLAGAHGSALQFRYLFVTDAAGLEVIDVTHAEQPKLVSHNVIPIKDAHRVYVARTYAYIAAGAEGLVIVNVERPEQMRELNRFNAGGALKDSRDVVVAATNASLFAYVADGTGGLKVIQLFSPESQPKFYGFSPEPRPQLIAHYQTARPALSLSKGLDRDRAVDETGGQIAVIGRRGAKPLTQDEVHRLYLDARGNPWFTTDQVDGSKTAQR